MVSFLTNSLRIVKEIYGTRPRLSFRLPFGTLRRDKLARQAAHGGQNMGGYHVLSRGEKAYWCIFAYLSPGLAVWKSR
jgi:hypothetical protein